MYIAIFIINIVSEQLYRENNATKFVSAVEMEAPEMRNGENLNRF